MSRRRGEFEHRTSLFEGAYRAWSHLGSLDPNDIYNKSPSKLDPLAYTADAAGYPTTTGAATTSSVTGEDDTETAIASTNPSKRVWRYEPLPRSGLEHPYVRSILNPWLGADAEDPDEVEQGLATLRNWWQHRRKGESRSALNALGSEKMKGIVDGYTCHFFRIALDLVKRDKAHPPKTVLTQMGGPKSERNRKIKPKRKKGHSEDEEEVGEIMTAMATARSLENARNAAASSIAGLSGLTSLEGRTATAAGAATDSAISLLTGGNSSSGLSLDHSAVTLELLLQQQRQLSSLDPFELAHLARQRELLAASAFLTPLERIHLAQRQHHLALLSSVYSNPVAASLSLPQSSSALTNYSPPNWLLEPVTRQPTVPVDDKST